MFPWISSKSYYDDEEEPSHQWTDYHNAVVHHHLKLGEMPHVETHTKAQAMTWATYIGDYFHDLNVNSLVASVVSLLVHHNVDDVEAKQIALELSHHCGNISTFANLIGSFWDSYITDTQRKGKPMVNTARLAANHFRSKARG